MERNKKVTIRVNDAVKKYGDQTVLKHVTLELEAGQIYGFVGQNGSGKRFYSKVYVALRN